MGGEWNGSGSPVQAGFDFERDLLCTADADGRFVTLNAAWEKVLGWTREELTGRQFIEYVHPDDVERTMEQSARVSDPSYELVGFENRFRTKAGGWRWLRWTAHSDGDAWFAVANDITEDKRSESRLRKAIAENRLIAYAQPIVGQRRGSVNQEELLVRMLSDDGGDEIQSPREFLPDAERSGLVVLIDRWMADRAIGLAAAGRPAEVNLSAVSICDEVLPGDLAEALAGIGAGAANVVFEITETAAIEHLDAAREFVERLSRLGCRFALDDFGTGFGSLTYLRHLPIQYLKIDVGFVRNLRTSSDDRRMVKSIVAMSNQFGLQTVAEGVEDTETLALVREFGIDYAQGFWIGRPRPLEGLEPFEQVLAGA